MSFRLAARRALRHWLVAMRYSQVRTEARSVNPASPRQAASKRLLQHVLGVGQRAEHPVAVHLQFAPVRGGELTERLLIAGPGALQRNLLHHSSMPVTARVPLPPAAVST